MTKTETDKKVIKTYKDLIVWQKFMVFVTDIYKLTRSFPKDEQFGIVSQMRRCSIWIPSNIAEGYGRNSTGDYMRFLQIAMGSIFEIQTQIQISLNLGFINSEEYCKTYESCREIERMSSALLNKLD